MAFPAIILQVAKYCSGNLVGVTMCIDVHEGVNMGRDKFYRSEVDC